MNPISRHINLIENAENNSGFIDSIIESTQYNHKVIKYLVELVVENIPNNIPEDSDVAISLSPAKFQDFIKRNTVPDDAREDIRAVLEILTSIALRNLSKTVTDRTMGVFVQGRNNSVDINVSGLFGNASSKTKQELLDFRGLNSIGNFKSILGHELRHVVQYITYTNDAPLPPPDSDNYDYNKDPIEIDASFMEALLDHNIDEYTDIQEYTNVVMQSLNKKKALSDTNKTKYYRKISKFYTAYKSKSPEAINLHRRLENYKKTLLDEFTQGIISIIESINSDYAQKIHDDYEQHKGVVKDDRQSYYINIPRSDVQLSLINRILTGGLAQILGEHNAHMLVSTIIFCSSISSIKHTDKVINKIYNATGLELTVDDTTTKIKTDGYFKKEPKYIKPIIDALVSYI